ncbi:esterase family protein [Sphingomonas sp. BK481]|uniref:alpha/beta hydrolase n=1 Tax=Sphingomonas sp. BK481 TaxID=2586981 RepID=UPI00161863ED|nr:alpha/beta hydrolase-fold protein [Sphingomonas sp. BK481]MBB3588044.1 enterochelin esterase family protein [Sphingomonas sp. BK481]
MRVILTAAALLGAALTVSATAAQPPAQTAPPPPPPPAPAPALRGTLAGPFELRSRRFAGTVRRYWVYVPPGYDPRRPPNLLLFQDGQRATNPAGSLRVPAVLDTLILQHAIPPTLGIFVTPGHRATHYPDTLGMANPDHRVEEYDALSDDYGWMTLNELLPAVAARWRFADDPKRRAIGGTSSGAIASWTIAWRHPEAFGNVISFIGSYTSIGLTLGPDGAPRTLGGDLYPGLIRKSPIRPLRIVLQDGAADLDDEHGNWFLANQQMAKSLAWANAQADADHRPGPRYDVRTAWTRGGHSDADGGAILPDMLRWIWRDQPAAAHAPPPTAPPPTAPRRSSAGS